MVSHSVRSMTDALCVCLFHLPCCRLAMPVRLRARCPLEGLEACCATCRA